MKTTTKIILSNIFVLGTLVGCSAIGSMVGSDIVSGNRPPQTDTLPVISKPDVEATECMEGYVCFTREDAVEFFTYVFTLEEAYEGVRE